MTTSPLTVRIADAADVDPLIALIHSAYRGPSGRDGWTSEADLIDGPRTTTELLAADLADPRVTFLVAGDMAGCAAVTLSACSADRIGLFGTFAVAPTGQRHGVGSVLLAAAEDHARAHGVARMEMHVISVRTDLIAWYERRGYAPSGRTAPFPYGDARYGTPRRPDLEFSVLVKDLT